jgi:hypothetical protein
VGVVGRADRAWLPGAPIVVQDQLALPADLRSGRYSVSLGLFDRSAGKDRPVDWALQATLREPEGYYRVAEVAVGVRRAAEAVRPLPFRERMILQFDSSSTQLAALLCALGLNATAQIAPRSAAISPGTDPNL